MNFMLKNLKMNFFLYWQSIPKYTLEWLPYPIILRNLNYFSLDRGWYSLIIFSFNKCYHQYSLCSEFKIYLNSRRDLMMSVRVSLRFFVFKFFRSVSCCGFFFLWRFGIFVDMNDFLLITYCRRGSLNLLLATQT